jgi:hypothetical protein
MVYIGPPGENRGPRSSMYFYETPEKEQGVVIVKTRKELIGVRGL